MTARRVVLFGASGFVGSAVREALMTRGAQVEAVTSPRLPATSPADVVWAVESQDELIEDLRARFSGADAVVNAAGDPDASSTDAGSLTAANAVLPGVLSAAAARVGVRRFVHVSSAVVLGDAPCLDDSPASATFSPYSLSKTLGERAALQHMPAGLVIFRPPSVHALDRRVTQTTRRIARSRISSVARPGSRPTPQALLPNVADAVAFLALTELDPPCVVTHPWEGLTTEALLTALGDRRPLEVPSTVCRAAVAALRAGGRLSPLLAANARRVEMIWFGQEQAASWLSTSGWVPPLGLDAWGVLGDALLRR